MPFLFTAELPHWVMASYPLVCSLVYAWIALTSPAESMPVYVLSGYTHLLICLPRYSTRPVQAYASVVIHFSIWTGIILYFRGGLGSLFEVLSLLGVAIVTNLSITHQFYQQKEAMAEYLHLERKQENFENLLNNISENIAVLSLDCKVLMKNRGFSTTFPGEDFALVASRVAVQAESSVLQQIEAFISHDKNWTSFRATANQLVYSCSLYKILWEQTDCVAFVSRDITQSIQLERMYSKSEGVSATLRSVSHEIKTPVNYLMHSLDSILQLEVSLSDWACQALQKSQLVAEYLLSCVSEIVDYTNAKAGRLHLSASLCDLNTVFAHVKAILTALCSDKQSVTVNIRTLGTAFVMLDSARLKQVLLNVGSNCLRYKNSVEIEARLTDGELSVCSTALGVQLNGLDAPAQGSVDEGVAIRFELIQDTLTALGGSRLGVSHDEKGSVVCFVLAVEEVSDASDYSVPSEEFHLWAPQIEALVVDDNTLGLQIMEEKLKAVGVQCETAVDGQVCLEKLQRLDSQGLRLKVIILDIQMPVLDGWQCAKQINDLFKAGVLHHLPYILGYSAFSSTEEVEKSIACGMQDVLSKPASNPELFAKLSRIFNRSLHYI